MPKNLSQRLIIIIGTLAFIIFAGTYQSVPAKAPLQVEFEEWLSAREEQFRLSPSAFEAGKVINIHVLSFSPQHPTSFHVAAASGPQSERVFRILGLLREANLFSISKWQTDEMKWPGISLVVEDGGRIFRTQLGVYELEQNLPIKTMLKLLQVFAASPLPAPTPTIDFEQAPAAELPLSPTEE